MALVVQNLSANAGDIRDAGSRTSPGQEDPLEDGMTTPLQYSCLENPMDRGTWWAIVHRVAKSWIWLKWVSSMHKHLWICFLFFNLFVSGQKKKFRGVCFFSAPTAHNWTDCASLQGTPTPSWYRLHQGVALEQQSVPAGHPRPGGSPQQLPQPKVLLSQILF